MSPGRNEQTQAKMDPEKYAIYSKQQRANGFQMFVENYKYISEIPIAGRALDIGCGTGDVAKLLTFFTNLGSIIGLDHSADMIEVNI